MQDSITDLEDLANSIREVGLRGGKEEKLKIETEKLLSTFLSGGEIRIDPSYEYTFISGRRADALYGHVIIEYEPPGALRRASQRSHSIRQIEDYITEAAKGVHEDFHRFFGVVLDGREIIFARYMSSRKTWIVSRPFEINVKSIGRMVEAIRALHKKPLDAELIIHDFGPNGEHAQAMIKLFYKTKMKSNRAKTLYSDWHRVFQQVSAYSPDRTRGLEKIYNLGSNVDYQKLLFSIHTYYAFS